MNVSTWSSRQELHVDFFELEGIVLGNRDDSDSLFTDLQDSAFYGEDAQKLAEYYRWKICAKYFGITVYVDPQDSRAEQFITCIFESLSLIKYKDPRRFARIRNTTKHIVLRECKAVARYSDKHKMCTISPSYLDEVPEYRIFTILWIATALVHEATHGRVYAAGIPYSKRYREAIEQLCRIEESRFLKRIDPAIVKRFRPHDTI